MVKMHRVDRSRRSAKVTVTEMAEAMLKRTNDEHINIKLDVLQTIASRMSWNDLFHKIKNRPRLTNSSDVDDRPEKPEPWWTR